MRCSIARLAGPAASQVTAESYAGMLSRMNGKVCVVTGGNGGIGRETAKQLAKRGAQVVLICRSKERGEEAQRSIVQETGNPHVELVLCDLSSQREVRRAAGEIL